MQNSFREGNAEKVKLWNSILTQVLPINNELTIPEQIQELCTNLYNGNLILLSKSNKGHFVRLKKELHNKK